MAGVAGQSPRWRRACLRLLFSLAALGTVIILVEPEHLRPALSQVDTTAWLTALTCFLGLHLVSALKWRLVLSMCGESLPLFLVLRAYGLALFANLCLPSLLGGDLVRAAVLMKHGAAKERVVLAAVTDRLLDILALGILVVLGLLRAPGALGELDEQFGQEKRLLAALSALALVSLLLLPFVLRRLHPGRLPRPLRRTALGFFRALQRMRRRRGTAMAAAGLCLGLQAGFVGVNIFLGRSMGLHMDHRLWFLLWPLAKVAAMAPLSLGGIGVREAAFVALAGPFANKALLLAQSLTWESILVAGGLVAGTMSLLLRRFRP